MNPLINLVNLYESSKTITELSKKEYFEQVKRTFLKTEPN